ncbi:hypothetical protein PHYBLDRAFT_161288 [Phycomyces blakesleeanus NRRL 1555(-)]|uniref:Uncharacterized protein n=1 Tax=Phycomyces blakesleeanus (strain ATCC 8743b / DSM 1359 / FGSC 10004 / NBRC 33097 / NRRL 1555) TaxID=763407 RepID=A0A163BCM1_PHYB8|nr:hypothetical protein PHYBLDRAFT_161288 [Phycomyces blakesleeanus NRRL 1555(-)]OAD80651.1 hypothetical protein PHYBLDRAFT_161288 [Phycomyces blakesleeanus NRRL 1555(-)]|eukprot:XP_018298691.1 hypothetical protein PHYBLDRAFT_161288 [Phycomyces blakesleeanus NRRL 1555(-)]
MAIVRPELMEQGKLIMSRFEYTIYELPVLSSTILLTIGALTTVLLAGLWLYLSCRSKYRNHEDGDDEERQTLLPSNLCLRRTATYYQWNRSPPTPSKCFASPMLQHSKTRSLQKSQNQLIKSRLTETWEHRRSALLKKYAAVTGSDDAEGDKKAMFQA